MKKLISNLIKLQRSKTLKNEKKKKKKFLSNKKRKKSQESNGNEDSIEEVKNRFFFFLMLNSIVSITIKLIGLLYINGYKQHRN